MFICTKINYNTNTKFCIAHKKNNNTFFSFYNKNYTNANLLNKYLQLLYNKLFNSKAHIVSIINFNNSRNSLLATIFSNNIKLILFFFHLKYLNLIKLKIINNYLLI